MKAQSIIHNVSANVNYPKYRNPPDFCSPVTKFSVENSSVKKCKAQIHTDETGHVSESTVQHVHPDTVKDVQLTLLKTACKRKASENLDTRPSKLIRQKLSSLLF